MQKEIDMDTVGGRIRYVRRNKNITQEELVSMCGMLTASDLSKIELNKRKPKLETMVRIANALGVELVWLRYGERGII